MEIPREEFDEVEFQHLISNAKKLADLAMEDAVTVHEGQETFFSIAIGGMLMSDMDGYIGRGTALDFFGHLLYHLSGLIPEEERKNMKAYMEDSQFWPQHEPTDPFEIPPGSFAEIVDENRLLWWISLEDWRKNWESDPYGVIPDISFFQREIGEGSGGLPPATS